VGVRGENGSKKVQNNIDNTGGTTKEKVFNFGGGIEYSLLPKKTRNVL